MDDIKETETNIIKNLSASVLEKLKIDRQDCEFDKILNITV